MELLSRSTCRPVFSQRRQNLIETEGDLENCIIIQTSFKLPHFYCVSFRLLGLNFLKNIDVNQESFSLLYLFFLNSILSSSVSSTLNLRNSLNREILSVDFKITDWVGEFCRPLYSFFFLFLTGLDC